MIPTKINALLFTVKKKVEEAKDVPESQRTQSLDDIKVMVDALETSVKEYVLSGRPRDFDMRVNVSEISEETVDI